LLVLLHVFALAIATSFGHEASPTTDSSVLQGEALQGQPIANWHEAASKC
jgi:hypothetical protein